MAYNAGAITSADVATLLARLQPLPADDYFTALGPDGRCLIGTPNGYAGWVSKLQIDHEENMLLETLVLPRAGMLNKC
jgi:hypothetical protein